MNKFNDIVNDFKCKIEQGKISSDVAIELFIDVINSLRWNTLEYHMDEVFCKNFNPDEYHAEEIKAAKKILKIWDIR